MNLNIASVDAINFGFLFVIRNKGMLLHGVIFSSVDSENMSAHN